MSSSVLINSFAPFPSLTLHVPSETPFFELPDLIRQRYPSFPASSDFHIATHGGVLHDLSASLSSLSESDSDLITLRVTPRVYGGKGGFGSQLRAAGGRMSSQKTSNNDSCRDLSGRRLSTVREAKKMAEYLESEPARKKAAAEAQREKLEKLERQLGIGPSASKDGNGEPAKVAGTKHRFDDTEYLEQSRDIVDNVKSAVSAALLKKRKKAKTTATTTDAAASTVSSEAEGKGKEKEKDAAETKEEPAADVPAVETFVTVPAVSANA